MSLCILRGLSAQRWRLTRSVSCVLILWVFVASCSAPAPHGRAPDSPMLPTTERRRQNTAANQSDSPANAVPRWHHVSLGLNIACGTRDEGDIECWGPRCAPEAPASHCEEISTIRGVQTHVEQGSIDHRVYVLDVQGGVALFERDTCRARSPFRRVLSGSLTYADHDDCLPDADVDPAHCFSSHFSFSEVKISRVEQWRTCSARPGKKQVVSQGRSFFLEADNSVTVLLDSSVEECGLNRLQPQSMGKRFSLIHSTSNMDLCGLSLDQRSIDCYQFWSSSPDGQIRLEGEFRSFGISRTHLCAVDNEGRVHCRVFETTSSEPTILNREDTWPESWARPKSTLRSVTCGPRDCCAITDHGGIECWGQQLNGVVAAPPSIMCGYSQMSVGYGVACAVDACGGLECWAGTGVSPPVTKIASQAPRRPGRADPDPLRK